MTAYGTSQGPYLWLLSLCIETRSESICPIILVYNFLVQVDPTYRSLIEETSVDYIQKFRELASQMNTQN